MKALIIYDSVFGNTERVAQAMGDALEPRGEVGTRRTADVAPEDLTDVDVLIVGSPTRGFQPTPDTKKLLKRIPAGGLESVRVAAFDTRFAVEEMDSGLLRFLVKWFGYAAKPIATRLERKGGDLIVAPEGFIVEGTEGPLRDGELERAAGWATKIADAE